MVEPGGTRVLDCSWNSWYLSFRPFVKLQALRTPSFVDGYTHRRWGHHPFLNIRAHRRCRHQVVARRIGTNNFLSPESGRRFQVQIDSQLNKTCQIEMDHPFPFHTHGCNDRSHTAGYLTRPTRRPSNVIHNPGDAHQADQCFRLLHLIPPPPCAYQVAGS